MAKLTAKSRNALPAKDFAGPGRSYPDENKAHAIDALSRVSANGSPRVKTDVRANVRRKYPSINVKRTGAPNYPKIAGEYVSLRRPKSKSQERERAAMPSTSPEEMGVAVHLEHHHLMRLKGADGKPIAGRMKSGNPVTFAGRGKVERSESRSTPDGERHSATIRLHHGAIAHRAGEELGRGVPKYPKEAADYVR
jgi:hypothetical protein